MIAAIRIRGQVALNREAKETLHRLRLRKKYACVIIDNPTESQLGALKKMRNFISYGEITEETKAKVIEARGKIVNGELKPFFALHPARGGMNTKLHYPQGVLGENKEIDKLLERML